MPPSKRSSSKTASLMSSPSIDETTVGGGGGDIITTTAVNGDDVIIDEAPAIETIPKQLESMYSAFKMCKDQKKYTPTMDMKDHQGSIFYAITSIKIPRSASELSSGSYMMMSSYMVHPLCPGHAKAPHEFARGSKKSKDQLAAYNKNGMELSAWADPDHKAIRFWSCEKKGFNRGNRLENVTWTYGGGHTMNFCLSEGDFQSREYEGKSLPPSIFSIENKEPDDDHMMLPFDLIRVSIMPKTEDGLKKGSKRTCFVLKGVAPTSKSLAGILPILKDTMPHTLDEAIQKSNNDLRSESLPYRHQIDCTPPKDDRDDYDRAELTTVSFLESNINEDTTFMYDENSNVVRMHVKPGNYYIDIPKSGFFKNANVTDGNLHTACGIYTLAAHCKGALHAFVMHGQFWGSSLWDPNCGFGDPTKFRGVPIIDASKIVAPLITKEFYLLNPTIIGEEGSRKAYVTVDLGIMMDVSAGDKSSMDEDEDDEKGVKYPVFADVTILPRKITSTLSPSSYSISSDLRISPHGNIPVDPAYVVAVFVVGEGGKKNTLLNLDYNGSRDVGHASSASSSTGKKHSWSSAIPSAIDEDDDEEEEEGASSKSSSKKFKVAMNSVA